VFRGDYSYDTIEKPTCCSFRRARPISCRRRRRFIVFGRRRPCYNYGRISTGSLARRQNGPNRTVSDARSSVLQGLHQAAEKVPQTKQKR